MTRLIQASALLGLLGCAAAPSPLPASRDACVVTTEVVNGFRVTVVRPRCANPPGSGSLRSLLAHELGHAWAWRHYGNFEHCDNKAVGNITAVAWESSQLVGLAERRVHNPPGCGCDD